MSAVLIKDLEQRWLSLRAEQVCNVADWAEAASHVLPHQRNVVQAGISGSPANPGKHSVPERLCSDAEDANEQLAAGTMELCTPLDGSWFEFSPAPQIPEESKDAVSQWLADCTERIRSTLQRSNFYSSVHQTYLQRGCFGTTAIFVDSTGLAPLNFQVWDAGTFVIAENAAGRVDTVMREIQMTAKQAVELFGDFAGAKPIDAFKAGKLTERFSFIHSIHPTGKGDFESVYWRIGDHSGGPAKVVQHDFFPAFVGRYLRQSAQSPYGTSPALRALPDIRRLNDLELQIATIVQTMASPRTIVPAGYEGVVDLRPGGITVGGKTREEDPKEWLTGGRPDFIQNFYDQKRASVEERFHKSLFTQFANIEHQITAREVSAREREKLMRFSPTFTLLTTEVLNPLLELVFMLEYKTGSLPAAPAEAFYRAPSGPILLFPSIVQTSRMSLAIQAARAQGWAETLELFAQTPAVLDNIDQDRAFRDIARSKGLAAFLRDESERDDRRAAAAQQQQMQMAAELAAKNPQAVKTLMDSAA
mgnify:CR=1 FL=1